MDFEERFATEESCRDYLFRIRWPDGYCCSRCGHRKAWSVASDLLQCADCGGRTSVTAGTIFQDTHVPLTFWFRAMWWITGSKSGISALGLQRILGLGSYETAWSLLHKLRRAMIRPGRERLVGKVEVDEAYLGAIEERTFGRGGQKKVLLVVAAEEVGRGTGRIRLRQVADASAASLHPFVEEFIEPGSVIHTDGWQGYAGLDLKGYIHEPIVLKHRKESAVELLPRVHRIISLLRRWLMGTHQGAVDRTQLNYYFDEFTFRFNRRSSRHRGKLFYRLAQQAMLTEPRPYQRLIKHSRGPKGNAPTTRA
jgi:transposase-like protein